MSIEVIAKTSNRNPAMPSLPVLMVYNYGQGPNSGLIVLATDIDYNSGLFTGTALQKGEANHFVGEFRRDWALGSYVPFLGVLEIRNRI